MITQASGLASRFCIAKARNVLPQEGKCFWQETDSTIFLAPSCLNRPNIHRLATLEGVRGLMAIWVFLTHALTMGGLDLKKSGAGWLLVNGSHAVSVFILLSGFVIAMMRAKSEDRYGSFIMRRAFRLFPIYLVAFGLSVLTARVAIDALQALPWVTSKNLERIDYLSSSLHNLHLHLLPHLILLHGLIPEAVLPYSSVAFMGQAWSLSLEWQFYLIAPWLVALCLGRRGINLFVALLVFAFSYIASRVTQNSLITNQINLFVAGILTYRLYAYAESDPKNRSAAIGLLFALCVAFIAPDIRSYTFAFLIWFVTICAELEASPWVRPVRGLLVSPVCSFMGRISYSFYCLHMLCLFAITYLLNLFSLDNKYCHLVLLLLLGFLLTTGLSHLAYVYIELPMIQLGKKIQLKREARAARV